MTRDHQVSNRVVTLDERDTRRVARDSQLHQPKFLRDGRLKPCGGNSPGGWITRAPAYDQILRKLTVLYSKGLLDIGEGPEIHMEGASNLVGLDLHLTREKTRELFRALEEKKRVLELLDRFLEKRAGEIGVHVGLAAMHPAMSGLSLIGLPVSLPNGISAVIAVLGPMRMDYARVMSAVQNVGWALNSAG